MFQNEPRDPARTLAAIVRALTRQGKAASSSGGRSTGGGAGGGGSASGYVTVQEEGAALTARSVLNFIGPNVTAGDDAGNSRTNVTILGGATDAAFPVGKITTSGSDGQLVIQDGRIVTATRPT